MKTWTKKNAQTILVAMLTAALTVGGPVLAARVARFARNAGKVDGKHAVGSKASKKKRRGKLVATNPKTGFLPNNIIKKAKNSNLLDGFDSTDFLGVAAKAADSDLLDGMDSTDFLAAGGTASDSDLLDGMDSSEFLAPTQNGMILW